MKKTTKNVLALTTGAALLVSASVMGTMAYLTSTESVKNTFTVGKVKIDLDETKVDLYGEEIVGADRVKANDYKLIPGHQYKKDPTVTVLADSEESYVRMLVTINEITDLKVIFGEDFLPEVFVDGWDKDKWISTSITSADDTNTYEFRYYQTVNTTGDTDEETEGIQTADLELPALFEHINFPADVTAEQLETIKGLEIDIVAQAIQADGFDDADDAWKNWN